MKQVEALKKKHRRDIWGDVDGYMWFWDIDPEEWTNLAPVNDGTRRVVGARPVECYAPYTRIKKGWR